MGIPQIHTIIIQYVSQHLEKCIASKVSSSHDFADKVESRKTEAGKISDSREESQSKIFSAEDLQPV